MTTFQNKTTWEAAYELNGIGGLLSGPLSAMGGFGSFLLVVLALSICANNVPNVYSLSLSESTVAVSVFFTTDSARLSQASRCSENTLKPFLECSSLSSAPSSVRFSRLFSAEARSLTSPRRHCAGSRRLRALRGMVGDASHHAFLLVGHLLCHPVGGALHLPGRQGQSNSEAFPCCPRLTISSSCSSPTMILKVTTTLPSSPRATPPSSPPVAESPEPCSACHRLGSWARLGSSLASLLVGCFSSLASRCLKS